jgi:hypothetical protein
MGDGVRVTSSWDIYLSDGHASVEDQRPQLFALEF